MQINKSFLKNNNSNSPEENSKLIPDEIEGKDSAAYLEALKQQIPMYKNNGLMPEIGA